VTETHKKSLILLDSEGFKKLCKRKEFSLRILAHLAKIDKKSVQDYWRGKRRCRPDTFTRLAEVLGWEEMMGVVEEGMHLAEGLYQKEGKELIIKKETKSYKFSTFEELNICRGKYLLFSESDRLRLYSEANGKCLNPNCRNIYLHPEIHHIIQPRLGERDHTENGIVLCSKI